MTMTLGSNLGVAVNGQLGELHYNELMRQWRAMDALIQANVKSIATSAQPGAPTVGDTYILPVGATGTLWAGNDKKVARYSSIPYVGMTWSRSGTTATVTHTAHQLVTGMTVNVTQTSDAAAITTGNKTITVINANSYSFTCLNAGATSGTISADEPKWEFFTPGEGWFIYVKDENLHYKHNGTSWENYNLPVELLENNVRWAATIDMANANMTMTDDDATAGVIVITNSGASHTLTWPTTSDGKVPVQQYVTNYFNANDVTLASQTGGSVLLKAGDSSNTIIDPGSSFSLLSSLDSIYYNRFREPMNKIGGGNYTFQVSDEARMVVQNDAGATNVNIDGNIAYRDNAYIEFVNHGTGTATLGGINGVSIFGRTSFTQYAAALIQKDGATNNWYVR